MHESDGCDLAVEERRGSSRSGEPGAFARMALRGSCVIRKDDQRGSEDSPQVFLDRRAPLRFRKPIATVEKLMPDGRGSDEIGPILLDLPQD